MVGLTVRWVGAGGGLGGVHTLRAADHGPPDGFRVARGDVHAAAQRLFGASGLVMTLLKTASGSLPRVADDDPCGRVAGGDHDVLRLSGKAFSESRCVGPAIDRRGKRAGHAL